MTSDSETIFLYEDDGKTESCSSENANPSGSSICDDVFLIGIRGGKEIRYLNITFSTEDKTPLYEVQVFAGKSC